MNLKNTRSLILASFALLLFMFLTVEVRAAAQTCVAEANQNPLVRGRSKSITFPDGRVITVVGHLHGTRQIYEISDLVDNGKLASMSDREFNDLLTKIMNENRKPYQGMITRQDKERFVGHFRSEYGVDISSIVHPESGLDLPPMTVENHAIADFQFLSQSLEGRSRVQFVGYEGTQETWNGNLPYYLRARQELLRQFYIRQARGQIQFTQAQVENLILSSSNGNVYAYIRNPDLARRVPMFGTEDQRAGGESQRVDPLQRMNDALQQLVRDDDNYWESKTEQEKADFRAVPSNLAFGALLMHLYSEVQNMNISSYAALDEMIRGLREKSPTWIRSSLENLFIALRERVRINFARDYESARNLVGRYETGIHFVGLNHFNNTIANLENFCRQELRSSGSRTTAPTSAIQ